MKTIEFTRIANSVNGKPRYVAHFFSLLKDEEQTVSNYELACKRANKLGGKKYRGKDFGGGIVFQSNNIYWTEQRINEMLCSLTKIVREEKGVQLIRSIYIYSGCYSVCCGDITKDGLNLDAALDLFTKLVNQKSMKTNRIILESDYDEILKENYGYKCVQHNAKYCAVFGAINVHITNIKTGGEKTLYNWKSYSYDGLCRVFDTLKFE